MIRLPFLDFVSRTNHYFTITHCILQNVFFLGFFFVFLFFKKKEATNLLDQIIKRFSL